MKKLLLLAGLLVLPSCANAQCNGTFPNNTVCGNVTGSANLPRATSPSAFLGAAGGTNGQQQYNNAGALGGFTQSGDVTVNTSTGVSTIQPGVVTNSKLSAGAIGTAKGSTNGTTVTDTLVSTLLSAACTVTPSTCASFAGYYNVTWYGAVCDGTTNDQTAIAAAMAAVPSGGRLIIPTGVTCLVNGASSALLTRTIPIIIDCQGSTLKAGTSVTSTTSFLQLAAPVSSIGRRWQVTNCIFDMNSRGQHTIWIDTSASTFSILAEVWIDHITDTPSASSTGYSIYIGNILTNGSGGVFNAIFHSNTLLNGIVLNNAGDSIRIYNSIISGAKYGLYANLISGAAGLIFEGNNVSAADPMLIDGAIGVININNNEFEQQVTNTDPNNAMVNIRGGSSAVGLTTFTNNSVISLAGTGLSNPLRIGNVSAAYVEANSFTPADAGVACMVNAAGAIKTIVGASNQWNTCGTHVSATVAVQYVQVGATP